MPFGAGERETETDTDTETDTGSTGYASERSSSTRRSPA
jgi:hypothetical protein